MRPLEIWGDVSWVPTKTTTDWMRNGWAKLKPL